MDFVLHPIVLSVKGQYWWVFRVWYYHEASCNHYQRKLQPTGLFCSSKKKKKTKKTAIAKHFKWVRRKRSGTERIFVLNETLSALFLWKTADVTIHITFVKSSFFGVFYSVRFNNFSFVVAQKGAAQSLAESRTFTGNSLSVKNF